MGAANRWTARPPRLEKWYRVRRYWSSAWEEVDEAARVHHAHRRCDGGRAACCAHGDKPPTRLPIYPSAQTAKALGSLEALIQGLKEHGWIEGQNFTFEYRFADGKQDALPKLAAELVRLGVDAIVTDSSPATQALKNATQTVPIIAISNDPVANGFVSSLSRPGGNIHRHQSFVDT
jgi:ABC transporter substrate binding protein